MKERFFIVTGHPVLFVAALGCLLSIANVTTAADLTFSDANWISMNPNLPSTGGSVSAAVVDGLGNLYIGVSIGGFRDANFVAKWNGSSWSTLGSGMNGPVSALAVSGSDVYAGGSFTTAGGSAANYIAKWDGSAWSALGSGMGGGNWPSVPSVYALAVSGSNVYAGGSFTTAGGGAANYIAQWNGSAWSAVGSGMGGGNWPSVSALAVSGNDLYAGGYFTTAGGSAATNIAKWNGSTWSALDNGVSSIVYALAVSGSDVYAGGDFETAGGSATNYIAKWNGSAWSALGPGVYDGVRALAVSGSDVYAGAQGYVAKWNGSAWRALGGGINSDVYALAMSGSDVYAGGDFTTADGSAANYIAKWNGSAWSALGSGIGGTAWDSVYALTVSGSDVYAGGNFTTTGTSAAGGIAKWNESGWSALGTGMGSLDPSVDPSVPSAVYALAVSGSDVYAAGDFATAGGSLASCIAKWNGSIWSPLAEGTGPHYPNPFPTSAVAALAVSGSNVYAGGSFTTAGGSAANYIAKWDGSAWSALGSGMGGGNWPSVSALAVSGGNVYAGGSFTTAGGSVANNIAKWNGSSWGALGLGMNDSVRALAVSGSDLYAGGSFTTTTNSGGAALTVNGIAKWNGSSWSALGLGVNGSVNALAVSGSDVYAGGSFTTATTSGGVAFTVNGIAKWNGTSWSALGSGMNASVSVVYELAVYALAVSGSDLYVGGNFTTAGGKVSTYVAKAVVSPPVLALEPDGGGGYLIRFTGVPGTAYRLERAPSLAGPWAFSASQTAPGSGLLEFWDIFPPPSQAFYRALLEP